MDSERTSGEQIGVQLDGQSPDIVVTSTKKKSGHLYHKDAARKVKSAARKALALRALQEGETTDASPGTRGMRPAYFALGEKLGTQIRYPVAMAQVVNPSDFDTLARAIVNITMVHSTTQDYIRSLISSEFEASKHSSGAILRLNSCASKSMGIFVRRIGAEFLDLCVGKFVRKIVEMSAVKSFEIDPVKIRSEEGQTEYAVLEENKSELLRACAELVDTLTANSAVAAIPPDILGIASYIWECGGKYDLGYGQKLALVGGFMILRFINPCIATPESYALLGNGVLPPPKARRNLVLLSKVLQNLSNGILFGSKEPHMVCINPFMESRQEAMRQFLLRCCKGEELWLSTTVGEVAPSRETAKTDGEEEDDFFSPLKVGVSSFGAERNSVGSGGTEKASRRSSVGVPSGRKASYMYITRTMSARPFKSDAKQAAAEMAVSAQYDVKDFVRIHSLLHYAGKDLIELLSKQQQGGESVGSTGNEDQMQQDLEFVAICNSLGPPPVSGKKKVKGMSRKEMEEKAQKMIEITYRNYGESSVDVGELRASNFLYVGNSTDVDGDKVIYIIASRMNMDIDINRLLVFMFTVMSEPMEQPYNLVIDMSWSNDIGQFKRRLLHYVRYFSDVFHPKHRKNLKRLLLVHPNTFVKSIVAVVLAMATATRRMKEKVVLCHSWRQLKEFIEERNIELPSTTKECTGRMTLAMKTNRKGKVQERYIKVTNGALMNVSVGGGGNERQPGQVRNSISFKDVTEVCPQGASNLLIHYRSQHVSRWDKILKLKKNFEIHVRQYSFDSPELRDSVYDDLMDAMDKFRENPSSADFLVTKVSPFNRKVRRFYLTRDSMVITSNGKFTKEIPYSMVSFVAETPEGSGIVWISFKHIDKTAKFECDDARDFVDTIQEGIDAAELEDEMREQDAEEEVEVIRRDMAGIGDAQMEAEGVAQLAQPAVNGTSESPLEDSHLGNS